MYDVYQNSSGIPLLFLIVETDHITPATGLSPTVTLSKCGSAFTSPIGVVSEIANGWYKVSGTGLVSDTNTFGPLVLHVLDTSGNDPTDQVYNVVSYNPFDSIRLGLSSLPSTGTIPTVGTGTNQIQTSGGNVNSNLIQVTGVNVNTSLAQLGTNIVNINGNPSSGAPGFIGIDWSKINSPGSTVVLTETTIGEVNTLAPSSIMKNSFVSPNVTGVADNYIDKVDQIWRRFFKKSSKDTSNIYTYADDNSTIITTQAYISSTTDTVGAAS